LAALDFWLCAVEPQLFGAAAHRRCSTNLHDDDLLVQQQQGQVDRIF
jgi:hypothetical protein